MDFRFFGFGDFLGWFFGFFTEKLRFFGFVVRCGFWFFVFFLAKIKQVRFLFESLCRQMSGCFICFQLFYSQSRSNCTVGFCLLRRLFESENPETSIMEF